MILCAYVHNYLADCRKDYASRLDAERTGMAEGGWVGAHAMTYPIRCPTQFKYPGTSSNII